MKSIELNLGLWNIYFIITLALFLNQNIQINFLYNFALILFLSIPTKNTYKHIIKQIVATFSSSYILYDESYLPPINHLISQLREISQFNASYLWELSGRFVSIDILLIVFISSMAYFTFHNILKISTWVITIIVILGISHCSQNLISYSSPHNTNSPPLPSVKLEDIKTNSALYSELNKYKKEFLDKQTNIQINLETNNFYKNNFDILVLSVCSLSWDDIKYFHLESHKLFKEFDILFENFNSATSYSGPAVIRLLQANCGQKTHEAIMGGVSDKRCYLTDNLAELGYSFEFLLNHDGKFDNFASLVVDKGHLPATPNHINFNPYLLNFDNSHIHRDADMFSVWLQNRNNYDNKSNKTFTLYNTVSLHDGVHFNDKKQLNAAATYEKRLNTLLDDMYYVLEGLKKSDKPTIVLFVPEHGANIKGDKIQIAGMRELPSPKITNVPVGLKVIGNNIKRLGDQEVIKQQTSYTAISHLVNQILRKNIFSENSFTPNELIKDIPVTQFVSENEGSIVMEFHNNYYYSFDNKEWMSYKIE